MTIICMFFLILEFQGRFLDLVGTRRNLHPPALPDHRGTTGTAVLATKRQS